MAGNERSTPGTTDTDKLGRGVLGVTSDGVHILKQRPSEHFTQKEAFEAVRKALAARQAG